MIKTACDYEAMMSATSAYMQPTTTTVPTASRKDLYELLKQAQMLDDAAVVCVDATKASVRKFLNRLLCLEVDGQAKLFAVFSDNLKKTVAAAKSDGTYDDGMADLKGSTITAIGEPQDVHTSGLQYRELRIDRGIKWETTFEMLNAHPKSDDKSGFYRSHTPVAAPSLPLTVALSQTDCTPFCHSQWPSLRLIAPLSAPHYYPLSHSRMSNLSA